MTSELSETFLMSVCQAAPEENVLGYLMHNQADFRISSCNLLVVHWKAIEHLELQISCTMISTRRHQDSNELRVSNHKVETDDVLIVGI